MIYFLDCEFDSFGGRLLSIALVRQDGLPLSLVIWKEGETLTPWVTTNVAPHFYADPHSREVERADVPNELAKFLRGDFQPVIVSDWPDDIRYFCECTMVAPGQMIALSDITFRMLKVQSYPTTVPGAVQHNAYWDAMALREALAPEGGWA